MTRNGYAKDGRGDDVGNSRSPQKMRAATRMKRTDAKTPTRRTHVANSFGMLVSKSAAAQSATPPPKDGTLASRPAAVPETSRLSPIAKTRKPAATQSFPLLKNLTVNR